MPEDQLRDVVNSIRTRLQAELDAQLEALTERQAQAVDRARQNADAEAEQRWTARLAEATATHQQAIADERRAAEADAEKRWTAQLEALTESQNQAAERVRQAAEADAEKRWAAQLAAVTENQRQAEERARQAAEADAEKRWSARLDAASAEWRTRLESEVAAARSEVERTMVAESMRVRMECEQAAAEATSEARRHGEQALADERASAQAALEAERKRAERELAETRAAFAAERETTAQALADARQAHAASEAALASAPAAVDTGVARPHAPDAGGLLAALRAIDNATSLSTALAAAVRGAAAAAPRVALFVVSGTELREWRVPGVAEIHAGPIRVDSHDAGLLGEAVRRNETITSNGHGAGAPAFASLPADRQALAVPFVLGGQPVAVLYADEGHDGTADGAAWLDAVQILGRHASACVAHLTAERTAQAMRLMAGTASPSSSVSADEDQGARRYARLLVSEIKLYNESAVRTGREKRDLLQRLRPEIDRARRLYDERIHPALVARDVYFQQELVQTLADGDASLLGSQAT